MRNDIDHSIKQYFARQAGRVRVPPLPELETIPRSRKKIRGGLLEPVFGLAAAAAMVLFIFTVGRETALSAAVDTVMIRYEIHEKINGFLEEAGKLYRNTGG